MQTVFRRLGGMILSTALFCALSQADTFVFTTPPGSVDTAGDPVSAEAVFTTNADGTIDLTLTNLQTSGFKDAGQVVSDVFFGISGIPTPDVTANTQTGASRTVASDGSFTDNGSVTDPNWGISDVGSTVHLDGLGKSSTPSECKDSACMTIIPVLGDYSGANNSITGNSGHNPFLTSLVFHLTVTGVTAGSVIDDVTFSFGTAGGDNIPAVPEPSSFGLLGFGALAMGWATRRYSRRAEVTD